MNGTKKVLHVVSAVTVLAALSCGPDGSWDDAMREPVRIETPAATFLVREAMVEDFSLLLAGEPTQHVYFAGAD